MTDTAMLGRLGQALLDVLDPLRQALQSPEGFEALMRRQGWLPPPTREYFATVSDAFGAVGAVEKAAGTLASLLDGDQPDVGDIVAAIDAVSKVIADLRALARPAGTLPPPFDSDAFWSTFPGDLLADLFMRYMEVAQPTLFAPLHLLGILDEESVAAGDAPHRIPYVRSRVEWSRLVTLVSDPASLGRDVYGWGSTFKYDVLLGRLERVLLAFGVPAGRYVPRQSLSTIYYGGAPPPDTVRELRVPLAEERRDDVGFVRVGFAVLPVPPSGSPAAAPTGCFVGPYAYGQAAARVELGGSLALELKGGLESGGDVGIELRPGSFAAHLGPTGTDLDLEAALSFEPQEPYLLIGSEDSHRIELGKTRLGLSLTGPVASADLQFTLETDSLSLIFDPSEGDSFVTDLFGTDPKTVQLAGGLTWSSQTGLHWTGAAGLSLSVPMHATFGPLTIQGIKLAIETSDDDVSFAVAVSGGAAIGPVQAVVTDIGVQFTLAPVTAPARGVFGDLDVQFGFRPPTGIGLSVDAQGVVTGGGFLFHDPARQLYAGVMQLSLHDQLTVQAFGLISTSMPDGSPGYSLLVFITAEDFEPIPLGLGFTLQGIGGMVAINRTFDEAVLRAGMQNDTLRSLLFPRDALANAPAIISALASAFPARRGSYLMGILARIGWGTPTLIWLDLALILEFGNRQRLLALGRISALLPSPDNDLVRLNLDAIGVLDLDQGSVAIDAMLVDSRLVHKFALTGAGALRAGGSAGDAGFVLAVGGFNPRFAPPAGVPSLPRVAIALSSGNNPRLICDAYFAITSNTVQFGARAQLHAEAYGFSVDADVGFDVLISRSPLHFIADFHASAQLKHGSHNLFKVSLEGSLEGPRPLRASGKASFEIFWCDFTVRFDKTLIDGDPPPPPPAIDVQGQLLQALSNAQSWRTDVPANRTHGVALRKLAPGTTLVIDPLGRLVVTQDVVPLNTGRDIDIFGGSPVTGARRFALGASLNGVTLTPPQTLQAAFAPAQFFDMTDDEKLASPSFEEMDAGMAVGSDEVTFDAAQIVAASVEYESIVIDTLAPPGNPPPPLPARYTLAVSQLQAQSATGAAARAPVRRVGLARFRTAGPAAVAFAEPRWAIVPIDAAPDAPVDPGLRTWSEHLAALDALNRGGALYQLVPAPPAS